jgi:hypothetical protein
MRNLLLNPQDVEFLDSIDVALITVPRRMLFALNVVLFFIDIVIIIGFNLSVYVGFIVSIPLLVIWVFYFIYIRARWIKFRYSTGTLLIINLIFPALVGYPVSLGLNYLKELIF